MPNTQPMSDEALSKNGVAPTSYRIVTIPKFTGDETSNNPPLALAHKFRDFRLLALKTSPGAFASTYDEESRRNLDQTLERLKSTKATQFVALAVENAREDAVVHEADMGYLIENDWLGTVVLMGPNEDSRTISARADPLVQMAGQNAQVGKMEEHAALHFHLNGIFVQPSARRSGMGRRLIEAALGKAREMTRGSETHGLHCTIIVDEWNDSARNLYARCGFEVAAKEIYGDDRIALRMELWEAEKGA